MSINIHNAVALLREDLTTIGVHHEGTSKCYTYKAVRALADTLAPGDTVLVKNKTGVTSGVVAHVDATPKIDVYSGPTLAWAFQRVNEDWVQQLEAQDAAAVQKLKDKQRESAKAQVKEALGITDATELFRLEAGGEE